MKKFLSTIFCCFFCLAFFYGYSQDMAMSKDSSRHRGKNPVAFGLKAGVNLANVVSRFDATPKGADIFIRPFGGFYVTIPSGKGFAVQPEVLFNGMGWKEKTYPDNKFVKYLFTCVSVPLLAKYSFENTGLAVYLGPQLDFLVSAKVKSESTIDIKEAYKSTGLSATGGIEYMFPKGFNVSLRYQFGLSNLVKEPPPDVYLKLHAITACVGYSF